MTEKQATKANRGETVPVGVGLYPEQIRKINEVAKAIGGEHADRNRSLAIRLLIDAARTEDITNQIRYRLTPAGEEQTT